MGRAEEIYKGSCFLNSEHYDRVAKNFMKSLKEDLENAKLEYENCKSDSERVCVFQKYFQWESISLELCNEFGKSSEISAQLRSLGNKSYVAKELDISRALRYYNLALCFAPISSEEYFLAYGNRSALFLKIDEPTLALRDVEYALAYNFEEKIKQKLLLRQAQCQEINSMKSQSKMFINMNQQGISFCEENFCKIKSPNKHIKNADNRVKISYSEKTGRRLVAKEDIPSGCAVVVDEAYAKALEKILTWVTEHCAYCMKPILGGIPNPETSFGMYCDNVCLDSTFKNEHKIFPYLHVTKPLQDHDYLLLIRVLLRAGPEAVEKIQQKNPKNYDDSSTKCSVYDSSSYESVCNLARHEQRFTFEKSIDVPVEFISMVFASLFKELFSWDTDFGLLSAVILRHLESLQYNILSLSEWTIDSGPLSLPIWEKEAKAKEKNPIPNSYGVGVFPTVALCNHSCDPNAIFLNHSKLNQAFIITSKYIRAGEEVNISYKLPFTRMRFEDRQRYFPRNYKFQCECYPCSKKLSVEGVSKSLEPLTKCPNCNNQSCQGCLQMHDKLGQTAHGIEEAMSLIRDEKFTQAFQILTKCSDFLTRQFIPEFEVSQVCQDLIRKVLVHLSHL